MVLLLPLHCIETAEQKSAKNIEEKTPGFALNISQKWWTQVTVVFTRNWMGPNIAPDSGNKPGANIVLVVVRQIYQSILIYSGALCTVMTIWLLVLWDNFYNKASSGQFWTYLNSGCGCACQSTDPSPSESAKEDQWPSAEKCHFSLWSGGTAGYSNVFQSRTFRSIKIDAVPSFRGLLEKPW